MDHKQLKEIRHKLSLTQKEMADKLCISRNYLALMETGRRNVTEGVTRTLVTLLQSSRLDSVDNLDAEKHVCETPAPYNGDVLASLADLKADINDVQNKLSTLLEMLGQPMRESIKNMRKDDT